MSKVVKGDPWKHSRCLVLHMSSGSRGSGGFWTDRLKTGKLAAERCLAVKVKALLSAATLTTTLEVGGGAWPSPGADDTQTRPPGSTSQSEARGSQRARWQYEVHFKTAHHADFKNGVIDLFVTVIYNNILGET